MELTKALEIVLEIIPEDPRHPFFSRIVITEAIKTLKATPALLEALERLQDHHCSGLCDSIPEEHHMTVMNQVNKAIEKAVANGGNIT